MKTLSILNRIKMLERVLHVKGPVYVVKVEGWGFGVTFPGDTVKRDFPWDINRTIGATYLINSKPPGRRFDTREEAEAWIEQDKPNYPKARFSTDPPSKVYIPAERAEALQKEIDDMLAEAQGKQP